MATSVGTAAMIWQGRTAWVAGNQVTGTGTPANTVGFTISSAAYNSGTLYWTYVSNTFFDGVRLKYSQSYTAPTWSTGTLYTETTGTLSQNGKRYINYSLSSGSYGYITWAAFPYVTIDGTKQYYGSPTARTAQAYISCSSNEECCGEESCCSCCKD